VAKVYNGLQSPHNNNNNNNNNMKKRVEIEKNNHGEK
jgi:hypothetical protein